MKRYPRSPSTDGPIQAAQYVRMSTDVKQQAETFRTRMSASPENGFEPWLTAYALQKQIPLIVFTSTRSKQSWADESNTNQVTRTADIG